MDLDQLCERVERRAAHGGRVIIGVCGEPGAGKSTLVEHLALRLVERALVPVPRLSPAADRDGAPGPASPVPLAMVVPMDGFHLADVALDRLGRRDRKGAVDTFDGWGYAALLERLRRRDVPVVFCPGFDRDLEQPLAGAIAVPRETPVVLTEGNYLLQPDPEWRRARGGCDEVWWCEVDASLRRERLVARHELFGKSPQAARAWVEQVDEVNARLIRATADEADLRVPGY